MNFHAEQEKARLIIRSFDYSMTGKANKSVVDSVAHDMETKFVKIEDMETFGSKTEETLQNYETKIREQQSILEMMSKTLKSQLQREIKTAVSMLKESAFDDGPGGMINMKISSDRRGSTIGPYATKKSIPSMDASMKRNMSLSPQRQEFSSSIRAKPA